MFRGGILAVSGSLVFQPLPLQGGFHFGRGSEKLGKPCVQSGGKRRGMFLQVVRACCYGMGGVAHGVRCEDGGGDADTGKRIFHCIGTGRDGSGGFVHGLRGRVSRFVQSGGCRFRCRVCGADGQANRIYGSKQAGRKQRGQSRSCQRSAGMGIRPGQAYAAFRQISPDCGKPFGHAVTLCGAADPSKSGCPTG